MKPEHRYDYDISYDEATGAIRNTATSRGFPVGGIGSGGFRVLTDGSFGMFRTNNNWFRTPSRTQYPKGTFLAIRCAGASGKAARLLRGGYHGGREYAAIANIGETEFSGTVPSFQLIFTDPALPVRLVLSGFTALIPHNVKDSSLPVAFFTLEMENRSSESVELSLLASFENLLGLGGSGISPWYYPLDGAVTYNSLRGNYAEPVTTDSYAGLSFKTSRRYAATDPRRRVTGEYLFVTDAQTAAEGALTTCVAWSSARRRPSLLSRFAETGSIPDGGGRRGSRGNAGAMALRFSLAPGEARSVPLYLLWWTPHHVVERRQRIRKLTGIHHGVDYGHYYENHFSSADELAHYVVAERDRLEAETRALPQLVEEAALPPWLRRYVLNSTDAVLTNSVLPRDGTLYTIEAVPWRWPFGGLTGTMDQRLASHPYTAMFFPELDRRELQSFVGLTEKGRVPHGNGNVDVALGTNAVPYGDPIKSFNRTEIWTDLPQSLILQLGKTVLERGDRELLDACWPRMTEMLGYLDAALVDDIPEGITTYDYMHYHPTFVYSAILHAATLRMMIELAEVRREEWETINSLQERLRRTQESTEELLWDRRGFYRTCRDRHTVFTSALAGDWIARYAGLGPVVPFAKAASHSRLQSALLVESHSEMPSRGGRNRRRRESRREESRRRARSRPLPYREADLDGREMPAIFRGFRIRQVNNPWQSIAYQAMESIFLGEVSAGLKLIKQVWDKGWYEGYPWDMDHWGMRGRTYMTHPILWLWDHDHLGTRGHVYMTHPSTWSLFTALSGVTYNAFHRRLTLSPRLLPSAGGVHVPVFLPDSWLMLDYDASDRTARFTVRRHFERTQWVEAVRHLEPDGSATDVPLGHPIALEAGAQFSVILPAE